MAGEAFIVNVDQCATDRSLPALVRQLFTDLRDRGYVRAGEFYRELSATDLDTLRMIVEHWADGEGEETEEHDRAGEMILLITIGLLLGEGLDVTEESAMESSPAITLYTSLEYLARHNMCKVFRENWSMDLTSDGIVAAPINDQS